MDGTTSKNLIVMIICFLILFLKKFKNCNIFEFCAYGFLQVWNFDAKNRLKREGSWQKYVSMREDVVWPVPDLVLNEVVTQFAVNPWMLHGMLTNLQVPKGEYVLETVAGLVLGRQII